MSASYPTKIILAMKSGGRCALKECRAELISEGENSGLAVVGEAAHIYGEKDSAARYKIDMTDEQRNHYDNLIYLCPTCHTKIDKQELDYPADMLFEIKRGHEGWVSEQRDEKMSEIAFAELEVASKAIASGQHLGSTDFHVITPEEKIQKNALTQAVRALILEGLSRSSEVSSYLTKAAQLDEEFPDRLATGFKDKYLELKKSFSGDALFWVLLEFAQAGKRDFKQQAASLAILSHLFHLCEIFEK